MGTGVHDPRAVDARYNSGMTHLATGNYDDAIADFSAVIDFNPQTTNAFYHRAQAYFARGDYRKAVADYTQAILLNPGWPKPTGIGVTRGINSATPGAQSTICKKPYNFNPIPRQHSTSGRNSRSGTKAADAVF